MARKSYMAETIEAAYQTWRKCGQNVEMTCRELEKTGYRISKPTIYDWSEKYNWKDRAARAEAEEQKVKDVQCSVLEKALLTLSKQQEKYEKWFEAQEPTAIDSQVTHAYNNLVQMIMKVDRQMKEKPDLYVMAPVVMDAFVKFVKGNVTDKARQDAVFELVDRFFEEVKPADAL